MSDSDAAPASAPTPPTELCANCGAPMYGPHCYECGQPKKGLIRQFSSILGDFFDTVLSLDQRVFRTIAPLYFKPGFLTLEYFAGRRVRYVTPLRLYFFLSVIAFLVIAAVTNPSVHAGKHGLSFGPSVNATSLAKLSPEQREPKLKELENSLAFLPQAERDKAMAEVRRELAAADARKPEAAATRPDKRAAGTGENSDDDEESSFSFNDKRWDPVTNPLRIDWLSDGLNQSLNAEIGEVAGKIKRLKTDPAPFVKEIFSLAPQALFVILPVFALLLKFFYLFKRRLYMEHLIVALHSHSFICFSLLVMIGLSKFEDWSAALPVLPGLLKLLLVLAWIWLFLYLLIMQKRVYRQGWIMTLLKYCVVGLCYIVLLSFGMVATMLVGLIVM